MKAGLLGRKLGHSLSPQIHRLFGDYEYRLYECEPEDVASFLRGTDCDFLNVTIPYKKTAAEVCDELSPLAAKLGNVNFVCRRAGRLFGDNTDAYGFARLLDSSKIDPSGRVCSVLGAGGAAETVRAVLEEKGAERVSFVRRGEEPPSDATLIVNATPVGMYPDTDGVRIDIARFPSCEAVVDLVYNPSPTRLVREARAAGTVAADGLVMLVAQAYRAYRLAKPDGDEDGNLILYGPPASGKSTFGRVVAAAMGRPFVDLDDEIVRREGCAIAEIFRARGEAAFRAIEAETLGRVLSERGRVVALGGGALLDESSRRLAEASGRVVLLACDERTLLARARASSARPLLAEDPVRRLSSLLEARRAHYASFPRSIRLV